MVPRTGVFVLIERDLTISTPHCRPMNPPRQSTIDRTVSSKNFVRFPARFDRMDYRRREVTEDKEGEQSDVGPQVHDAWVFHSMKKTGDEAVLLVQRDLFQCDPIAVPSVEGQ